WYTGSASWMYRLGTEMLLGIQRIGGSLKIEPHVPQDWSDYQINYRFGKTMYHIRVQRGPDDGKGTISMDGNSLPDGYIPLSDDGGMHEVVVRLSMKQGM
ncbi:MAG TPA: hypothetical protein VFY25_07310, partial [Anaerolineales bacterium]|nr:hypothetical protein [Anaerolineales bacterium]